MHQDNFAFPDGDRDWEGMGLMPIGIVRRDEDDDWHALALDDRRGAFMVDGDKATPLDREEVGPAIFQAMEDACERLWGHSWNSSIGEIFALNRRTVQRDRVAKALLPPRVLAIIAYVSSADDGEELAEALIAVSRYAAKFKDKQVVKRYIENAVEVFYGDYDREIGIRDEKP